MIPRMAHAPGASRGTRDHGSERKEIVVFLKQSLGWWYYYSHDSHLTGEDTDTHSGGAQALGFIAGSA